MSSILSSAPLIPTAKAHPPSRSAQSVATSIALAFVIIIPFRRPLSFSLLFSVPTVGVSISVCLRNHHNQTAFQPDIDHNQTGYRVRPNRTAPSDGGTASARAAPPPPQAHVTRSRRGHSAAAPQRRARAALAALSCPASACAAARNRLFSFLRRMRNSPSPGRPESERCYCRLLYFL